MTKRLWLGLSAGLMVGSMGAHVHAIESDEVVVTATRTERSIKTVGSSVTVISREDIERSGQLYALELLRSVPGVEVTQLGGPGKTTSVFMRGAASSQTLVLIDGVRVNSTTSGGYDFADLSTSDIERIEVLRGPQSTLYGSEAIGGVVSITTRKGGATAKSASVEGGSLGLFGARGSVRGGGSRPFAASVSYEQWDGVSVASESLGNTEEDGYENISASFTLGGKLGGGRYDTVVRFFEGESDLDGFGMSGPEDVLDYVATREGVLAGVTYFHDLGDASDWSVHLGVNDESLEGVDPVVAFNNYTIDSQVLDLDVQMNSTLSVAHLATAGYTFEKRNGENVGGFDESLDIHSVFVQDQWTMHERMYLTLGARIDDHSEFGNETTYRADYAWIFPEKTARLHASIGSGFRAPTLNDLYFPGYGNLDLNAETSVGWELGYEQALLEGELVLDVTYFASEIDDLIGFDTTTFAVGNTAEAEISGVEASAVWMASEGCTLSLSHTYTDPKDKSDGSQLARRSKNRTVATIAARCADVLTSSLSVLAVSDRVDTDGTQMDNYERVDIALSYKWTELLTPYLRVQNVLDQDYEEVPGYTTPGIVVVGGLRGEF